MPFEPIRPKRVSYPHYKSSKWFRKYLAKHNLLFRYMINVPIIRPDKTEQN
jgi:hypothetical protein